LREKLHKRLKTGSERTGDGVCIGKLTVRAASHYFC
jgi:hypothetical protein